MMSSTIRSVLSITKISMIVDKLSSSMRSAAMEIDSLTIMENLEAMTGMSSEELQHQLSGGCIEKTSSVQVLPGKRSLIKQTLFDLGR